MDYTIGGAVVLALLLLWRWVRRAKPLRIRVTHTVTASGGGVVTGFRQDGPAHIVRRIHSLRHMSPALGKRAIRRRNVNRAEGESCRFG
jgi:hypothetical protein